MDHKRLEEIFKNIEDANKSWSEAGSGHGEPLDKITLALDEFFVFANSLEDPEKQQAEEEFEKRGFVPLTKSALRHGAGLE